VTKLMQSASVIVVLGGLGLFLSSSCGSDTPATVADNSTGGSAGAGGNGTGGATTGGGAGSSAGSGGSSDDLDASIFVDGMVEVPDGAILTGDSSLEDDSGDPPLEDAGSVAGDGAVVKKYGIYCYGPEAGIRKACTGPVTSCCYDSDNNTGTCSALKCPTTDGTYRCDGPEDCDVGQVCCGSISTVPLLRGAPHHEYSTYCTASCGTGLVLRDTAYVVVCKRSTDCKLGQSCLPATNMPAGLGVCATLRAL
jgi:hypothetical protein